MKCSIFIAHVITMIPYYYLQASVMTETLGWWVEQLSIMDAWRFAGMKFGVLCVMTSGPPLMLQLPADSWDSLPQVRNSYLMQLKGQNYL